MGEATTVSCDLCTWTYTGLDARVKLRTHLRTEHQRTEAGKPTAHTTYHQEHFARGLSEFDRRMLKGARIGLPGEWEPRDV